MGISVHWEHRSFKEQGIDREPTIHIGAVANALERKGIQTERGNINREIIKNNMLLEQAKEMLMLAKQELHSAQYAKIKSTAVSVKNEVMEMIEDKEHKDSLSKYAELKERMQSLLQNGEKIMPKQWKAEIQSLQSEYVSIGREQTKTATELAYAEVIGYNKKNLERELQNESRQHNRQQSKTKQREEEI